MATNTAMSAGEEIDSRCLKCKDVTNHTIIAMLKEEIVKVQCNVCGGRHNFRPVLESKTKGKSDPAKKPAVRPKSNIAIKKAADIFSKITQDRNLDEALPYTMTSTFGKNDLINHPTFGIGLVTGTIAPNKIELTFKEGPKVFICQLRSASPLSR